MVLHAIGTRGPQGLPGSIPGLGVNQKGERPFWQILFNIKRLIK